MGRLGGHIAVVAGGTRATGRGIAVALGEEGATVYVTGRTMRRQAVTPGFLRSEAMLERFGVTEENWRDGVQRDPNFAVSETPLYIGRAVAALAADPNVSERGGRDFAVWTLAKEYGFTDRDGTQPDWGTHYAALLARQKEEGRSSSLDSAETNRT